MNSEQKDENIGQVMEWKKIEHPGAYVSKVTGRLYRLPPEAFKAGRNHLVGVEGPEGTELVTLISSNPDATLEELRALCAQANIEPQF